MICASVISRWSSSVTATVHNSLSGGGATGAAAAGGRLESTGASNPPTFVLCRARAETGDDSAAAWTSLVPSTTMPAPQRLQVILTLRPRTLSSGTAYFAGQLL